MTIFIPDHCLSIYFVIVLVRTFRVCSLLYRCFCTHAHNSCNINFIIPHITIPLSNALLFYFRIPKDLQVPFSFSCWEFREEHNDVVFFLFISKVQWFCFAGLK